MFKEIITSLFKYGTGLVLLILSAGNGFAQTGNDLVKFAGGVPVALTRAQFVGHHDPSSTLNVTVALKLRNTVQLHAFLEAVTDPTSSEYHQFLTPRQFTTMYGPTQNQVAAIVGYLEGQGLQVTSVTPDNRLIHVTARSGAFEQVLGVQIDDYTYHGRNVYGTQDEPRFPSNIASVVESVLDLSNIARFRSMLVPLTGVVPLSSTPSGYSPQQIATAYNWPSMTDTNNGAGVIIANATADSPNLSISDFDGFWSYYGLPTHTVKVITVGDTGDATDGTIETTTDEEWGGAMAPGATLWVYVNNTSGITSGADFYSAFTATYDEIVNDDEAQVMTTSWAASESELTVDEMTVDDDTFQMAAALGIEVFAAVGDYGSSDGTSNPDEAVYPSSDPYVVAAGGTTLTLNSNNTIASEVAWSYTGGAQSSVFPEPPWQVGTGVPQNGVRNTSDISMDADPDPGFSLYYGGSWTVPFGGTSFVAPELAGLFAVQISLSGSTRLGQANSAIYANANSTTYAEDFNDITSGNNGDFNAGVGWDHPTGWGSPNASNLVSHIGSGSAISAPTDLAAEYLSCKNKIDEYLITWQKGSVGTPTAYDLDYEYDDEGWVNLFYGGATHYTLTLTPGYYVTLRVRATNGVIWSAYTSKGLTGGPCVPPQVVSGG
ncbi:MAG: S53 family peptidase [Gammaproteobacteria bacterium]